ncbi:MAG: hypothetical protein ACOYL3_16910 [Desulfuromonadaceae bacterium]
MNANSEASVLLTIAGKDIDLLRFIVSSGVTPVTKKFVLCAKPPKKLSVTAKQLLDTCHPNKKALERAKKNRQTQGS